MMTQEREIEARLNAIVAKHGGHALKWVCPGWAGVPDRILLLPGGGILFVETKRPQGGRMSALQKYWRRRLVDLGFEFWRVQTFDDLADIDRYIADLMKK